jgi:hypothetical protein
MSGIPIHCKVWPLNNDMCQEGTSLKWYECSYLYSKPSWINTCWKSSLLFLFFFFCFCLSNRKAFHRIDSHPFDDIGLDIQVVPTLHAVLSWVESALCHRSLDRTAAYQLQLQKRNLENPREPGLMALLLTRLVSLSEDRPLEFSKMVTCPEEDCCFCNSFFALRRYNIYDQYLCY